MENYTYMGTVDDVVRRYPWRHGWSIESINHQLIHSVIYGQKLVINDGYIITNPELLGSLRNLRKSLLGNVLQSGNAALFCRSEPRNLAEGLLRSKERLQTHKTALSGENEADFIRKMETLQKHANQNPIQWPRDKNTGAIFASFLDKLNYDNRLKLSLPDDEARRDFDIIYSLFSTAMDENFNEARQEWERICWREFAGLDLDKHDPFDPFLTTHSSYKRVQTMMHIANEAYHLSYASAMSWSLRGEDVISRPLTAFCPAYFDIFEKTIIDEHEHNVRYDGLGSVLICVDLLRFNGDFSWIMELVLNDDIVKIRDEYLLLLENYIHWEGDLAVVKKTADAYRRMLATTVSDHIASLSDIAESLFNFFGGNQIISALQAIDSLASQVGISSPINLDPVKSVKQLIEPREVSARIGRTGINSTWYGSTKSLARNLGLINAKLDIDKVATVLEPIKPYNKEA